MENYKVGNFIALKRKEKNLTQRELASKLGVSDKTVSKWECGNSMPDYVVIDLLCNTLDITPSELLNGSNEKSCLTNEETKNIFKIFNLFDRFYMLFVSAILVIFSIPFLIIFQMIYNGSFKNFYNYFINHFFDGSLFLICGVVFFGIGLFYLLKFIICVIKKDLSKSLK